MFADAKRLQQVLKNLLSNAFKFTHQGHVTLTIEPAKVGWDPQDENLNRAKDVIAISVMDTGIGISPEKQQIIFEAFQQADGSTSRKYGGTGLGLAISRELSRLLGGEIRLVSAPRVGSTFTLYLPLVYTTPRTTRKVSGTRVSELLHPAMPGDAIVNTLARSGQAIARDDVAAHDVADALAPELPPASDASRSLNEVGDDRDNITLGDPVIMIVENDLGFARFLLDAAREKGFKGIVTSLGVSALALAAEYKPAAVTLDIFLPDIEGWRVLDRLKNDPQTRHIAVSVISTDESRERALDSGAYSFLTKPIPSKELLDQLLDDLRSFINRGERVVLAIALEEGKRVWFGQYLGAEDVKVLTASSIEEGGALLARQTIDCMILDASLTPLPGRLLDDSALPECLPIVVYGEPRELHDSPLWNGIARTPIVREARSPERLLDQVSFFLHRLPSKMPDTHRDALREHYNVNEVLAGKKAMIVDDDMRNIFALSTLLEDRGMLVVSHDNGRDAIVSMQEDPEIDVVLMDIMMPEMDGVDTIREIRRIPACRDVPIIAVTAKAMKGDREKCMEAGAWDYLSKPVDPELMVGVLRAWLSR